MNRLPIIALDFNSSHQAVEFLSVFEGHMNVKVGMELYYKEGPAMIARLKDMGHSIFLDLKLHDIPNTVKSAMTVLASLEVDMLNVHAAGGSTMMTMALEGLDKGTPVGMTRPSIIAVTQLTSTDQQQLQKQQLIERTLEQSVLHYATLTKQAGLDGVVCSVHESSAIRDSCGDQFFKVTPGIRLLDGQLHDQKRVATPQDAKVAGSTHIVVGRAITEAPDPVAAYLQIKELWEGSNE